ncbi:hypothetical protein [Dictyobacter arantiisoli]|uniref:CHRD domain-containing protein n=1 Tax=Dictyobacter arantiisoli TaxID=2014874 RepID=A0A5A5TH53_9CHLR|nr:hypothetical protein [Dictyobacter arantiisoli]GCF10294.1 hypothetical protein KDI_38580 [Dictyobacter arantiisoli]
MYFVPYSFKFAGKRALYGLASLLMLVLMLAQASHAFASAPVTHSGHSPASQDMQNSQMRMRPAQLEANFFIFTGSHTYITYNQVSAQLSYQGSQGKQTWNGSNIGVQDSSLGTLITVYFPGNPDVGIVALTLLLPPIDLISAVPAHFETLGIYVHHRGFILLPPARLTYSTIALRGTAQHIL